MDEIELDQPIDGHEAAAAPDRTRRSFSVATRNAFFARVSARLRDAVPDDLNAFTARPMFNLMKVAFQNDRVHYEVAIDLHHDVLEIALHFEDGPVSTMQYLAYFDRHIVELKDKLGHEIELERWTASWARVYELWPLESLDQRTADRVAARLAVYIAHLQPLVEASQIRPERSTQPPGPPRTFRRQAATR